LECGPHSALATKQAVSTDDPSVPVAIKTLSLASGWTLGRGPFLVKGQWLVPALAVRQRRVAQGNFSQHAPCSGSLQQGPPTLSTPAGGTRCCPLERRIPLAAAPQGLRDRSVVEGPVRVGHVRRQNIVMEHQASPADAAHTPVRIDARVRKRQHVASHARRFLASHRTNNTARTTSNQAHLGMRLECSAGLADTSARSPRLRRGLVSSPGHNAHASAPFISRSSDSEGCCSAVDLGWVYATVASRRGAGRAMGVGRHPG
jgi:hypothetical protein